MYTRCSRVLGWPIFRVVYVDILVEDLGDDEEEKCLETRAARSEKEDTLEGIG